MTNTLILKPPLKRRKVKTHLLTRPHLFRINFYGKSSQMSHGYLKLTVCNQAEDRSMEHGNTAQGLRVDRAEVRASL